MSHAPYFERYHWDSQRLLEPAYTQEARDEAQQLADALKRVDTLRLDELSQMPGLSASKRRLIDARLEHAKRVDGDERAALNAEALSLAKDSIRTRLLRQQQLRQRALSRMVDSLQGTSFVGNPSTAGRPLSSSNAQAAGSSSAKAQAIIAQNMARQRRDALSEQAAAWQPLARGMGVWVEAGAPLDTLQARALGPLAGFMKTREGLSPELMQVALGTRLLVLYEALRRVCKDVESGCLSPANASITRDQLMTEVLSTVQHVRTLPPHLLLAPLLASLGGTSQQAAGAAGGNTDKTKSKSMWEDKGKVGDKEAGTPTGVEAGLLAVPGKAKRNTCCAAVAFAVLQALGAPRTAQLLADSWADLSGGGGSASGHSAPSAVSGSKGGSKGSKHRGHALSDATMTPGLVSAHLARATAALKLKACGWEGLDLVRFQLNHMPHLLERASPGPRDPRVAGFVPDTWQRCVLDVVDKDGSAVVSAPTSSGKTFIASYVIDHVLREGAAGRAVLVVPTKALVNPVAAQVYKDFGGADGAVLGLFTRDFRENVERCRVLITVPACLEILVLSPAVRPWVQDIRYLILDEVHCMNERGGGAVWERLMLALRCPLLALSATIGNPVEFHSWLVRVKQLQRMQDEAAASLRAPGSYEVSLITHHERFNDLKYHVYAPPQPGTPSLGHVPVMRPPGAPAAVAHPQQLGQLLHMHPLAAVKMYDVRAGTTSCADLALMPSEALQLFDAMAHAAVAADSSSCHLLQEQIQALEPSKHLGPDAETAPAPLVTRPAAKAWSVQLQQLLDEWARAGGCATSAAESVLCGLSGMTHSALDDYESSTTLQHATMTPHGSGAQDAHLLPLLLRMKEEGMLPCILFNFDRRGCERYATKLLEALEAAEAHYRTVHANALKEEVRKREQARQAAEAQQAAAEAARRSKAGARREDDAGAGAPAPHVASSPVVTIAGITFTLDPALPSPSFTFLPPSAMASNKLAETVEELADILESEGQEVLGRALLRGIGVHHSGMHKWYRQAVEMLFRSKTLQVVAATGTLAYGLHMPCKAVVMAGDSVFLDALNFRQMSGRAGRRGLDPLGHVLFYHVPMFKVCRLLSAPLPRLRGQFLMTPTLVLRAALLHQQLQLQHSSNTCVQRGRAQPRTPQQRLHPLQEAAQLLGCIVQQPFMQAASTHGDAPTLTQPMMQQALLHSYAMAVRHLLDCRLLSCRGDAVGLAGLATHLFWTEPANLAFVRLLSSGALHDALKVARARGKQPQLEALATVMAHLFMREPLHASRVMAMRREAAGRSPSVVVLPPMPGACATAIEHYNEQVVSSVVQGLVAYAAALQDQAAPEERHRMHAQDCTLPLSGVQHMCQAPPLPTSSTPSEGAPTFGWLMLSAESPLRTHAVLASPFTCLLGGGDMFGSVGELAACRRPRIHVSPAALPVLELRDRHARVQPLNAYFLDFVKHGQKSALAEWNGIPEGDAWELLHGMQGVLAAVVEAVELAAVEMRGLERGSSSEDEEEAAAVCVRLRGKGAGAQEVESIAQAVRELHAEFNARFREYNVSRLGR